jgi:tetratricopeptide (TPR) repeat protein
METRVIMTQSGKEVLVGLRSWILRSISGQAAATYPSAAPAQPVGPGPSLGQQLGPEQQFLYAEELNNQGRPELAVAFYRQAYVLLRGKTDPANAQWGASYQLALPERTSGQPILSTSPQQPFSPVTPNPTLGSAERLVALREKLTSANAAAVEQELRQLITAGNRGADSFGLFGMCQLLQNRPEEAERAFREALKLDSGHYRSLVNLGGLLLKGGRLQEAVPLLENSLKHTRQGSPESLAALTNLAVAQSQLGRSIEAAQLVLRIFRIKPDHLQPDKLVTAATSLEEMGDDPAAIELLQYLRSRLRDPGIHRRPAEALERFGDYQQAALVYRELAGSGTP